MPDNSRIEALLVEATEERLSRRRKTLVRVTTFSAFVTAIWFIGLIAGGMANRVANAWPASVTMVAGSFVAGATPQGGGAVAFPVFTKVLETPPHVARSFGLCIQAVGMGTASLGILLTRAPIALRCIRWALSGSIIGFVLVGIFGLRWSDPFVPSRVDSTIIRLLFTVFVTAMGARVALRIRTPFKIFTPDIPATGSARAIVFGFGLAGGALSMFTGSGADVALFVSAALIGGVEARRAIASSVLVMATLSVIGFVVFGLVNGQLRLQTVNDDVIAIGNRTLVDPLPVGRYDLLAMWMAAVPVVVWFAPLGAAFAARARPAVLAGLVASLAAAEFLSTVIFVPEVRRSVWAALLLVGGTGAAIGLLTWAEQRGDRRDTVARRELITKSGRFANRFSEDNNT